MTLLSVALAGGVGAVLRMLVGTIFDRFDKVPIPLGTPIINVTGAFLLGLLTGLLTDNLLGTDLKVIFGTGLLGGYTTFSTASVDAVNLARSEEKHCVATALTYTVTMLVLSIGAGYLGLWLG